MKEEKIELDGKFYNLKELKYKDVISISSDGDNAESAKRMILLSTGMTEEEYNELPAKHGIELQTKINELNGFANKNFQQPAQK